MKQGLLDFLQSASNMSAETVSVPVDMISGGLLSMGVPVGESPVMSSKWMKKKGLIKDVEQNPYSIAGQSVGLLLPAAMFTKPAQFINGTSPRTGFPY